MLLLDVPTGQILLRFRPHGPILRDTIAFSPDGKILASINRGGQSHCVRLSDVANGQVIRELYGHAGRIDSLAFSPDGNRLVSGGEDDKTVKVWDVARGEQLRTYRGHTERVRCVAFSPDGQRVASAANDGYVRVWDATKSQEAHIVPGTSNVNGSIAVSPDGKFIARVPLPPRDPPLPYQLPYNLHRPVAALLSPYAEFLTHSAPLVLMDMRTGQKSRTLRTYSLSGFPVASLAFSPDGRRLASAYRNEVQVWEVATGTTLVRLLVEPENRQHNGLAFSPDGQRLAFSGNQSTVEVWDLESNRQLSTFRGHTLAVMGVAFSPDGTRVASVGFGQPQPERRLVQPGEAKVWDVNTGREVYDLPGHTKNVNGVAFSPDGRYLVTGSWDRMVRVWDLTTGRETLLLGGHSEFVFGVAFSEDGKRLATGGMDGVKLWDWPSGREILSLQGRAADRVRFLAGGQRLAADTRSGVTIWDATPLDETPSLPASRK
jgi:WD40 repeat protein